LEHIPLEIHLLFVLIVHTVMRNSQWLAHSTIPY